ncbi:uncharacterized protein LOC119432448, partial [Dermacentor silvarum]|uniref:uncharacterized protein LOC119432448 n=1 Tax=Dermacentor silvarum TaxID=543639 RepID=UPI0018989B20
AAIEKVSTVKYLGVHISSDLTWHQHIDHISSKASKTLGFVRRHLYSANQATKVLAYITLVRPQLEYAAIIWNPDQEYLNNKLESLQNKAARFVMKKYSRYYSVTDMKLSLNLCMLKKRRLVALLSHFHRLYHNPSAFTEAHIKPALRVFPRLDHPFKVQPKFARTKLMHQSPLFLAIYHWNRLPAEIASENNHDAFVSKLKCWMHTDK